MLFVAFEVADKTGGWSDRNVFALHDLAVAAGAAQFLPKPQFCKVRFMIEDDALKVFDPPFQHAGFVTAAS